MLSWASGQWSVLGPRWQRYLQYSRVPFTLADRILCLRVQGPGRLCHVPVNRRTERQRDRHWDIAQIDSHRARQTATGERTDRQHDRLIERLTDPQKNGHTERVPWSAETSSDTQKLETYSFMRTTINRRNWWREAVTELSVQQLRYLRHWDQQLDLQQNCQSWHSESIKQPILHSDVETCAGRQKSENQTQTVWGQAPAVTNV